MPCSNMNSVTHRVISPPDPLALALTLRENDSALGPPSHRLVQSTFFSEDLLLVSSFARHCFAKKEPTVDVCVCVAARNMSIASVNQQKMHMMDNRLRQGCGHLENGLTAVHKRTACPRVRHSPCTSTIFTNIPQCFFQSLPPPRLLHSSHFPMHFQHPPTMWYMRSAADPLVGHQCRGSSPIAASHSLSALV